MSASRDAWEGHLMAKSKGFQAAAAALQTASFAPKSLRFTGLRDHQKGWGVTANFTASDHDQARAKEVRDAIRDSAPGCGFEARERPWHVTLAYPRKANGPMPSDVAQQVVALVEGCVAGSPLGLQHASLPTQSQWTHAFRRGTAGGCIG